MSSREGLLKVAGAFMELYNYVRGPMVPQAIQFRDAVVKIHEGLAGQIADSEMLSSIIEWFNAFQNIYAVIGLVGLVFTFVLGLLGKVLPVVVTSLGVWISYLIWRDHDGRNMFMTGEKGFAFFACTWLGLLLIYRAQGIFGKVCFLGVETLVIWILNSMSTTTNMENSWDDSNIHEIISRANLPLSRYSSSHDLCDNLCTSPFSSTRATCFAYDRRTSKKCWMLGARFLLIDSAEIPENWKWTPDHESRFSQVAELRLTRHLKIKGLISTSIFSPRTTYAAYFVYKFSNTSSFGFHERPVSLRVVRIVNTRCQVVAQHNRVFLTGDSASQARRRNDGWMEIKFGEISYIDDSATVECVLEGSESFDRKIGLIVEGIEFRPR